MFDPKTHSACRVCNECMNLFAVTYAYDDRADERGALRADHLEYLEELVDEGSLLAYGKYADSRSPGALFIYLADSEGTVEEWVAGDPFVAAGLVPEQVVRSWPALGPWPDLVDSD
jgi:hypothetical protein